MIEQEIKNFCVRYKKRNFYQIFEVKLFFTLAYTSVLICGDYKSESFSNSNKVVLDYILHGSALLLIITVYNVCVCVCVLYRCTESS